MDTPSLSSNSSSRRSFNVESHDILVCDICLEPYDDHYREAKFLHCHHSFCEHCLEQVVQDQDALECPTCRTTTSLGPRGVAGLQTNFYINYMRDTFTKLGVPKLKGCQKHSSQPMSFFCHKCGVAICRDCTVLDHKESEQHVIQDIATAQVEQRQMLANQINGAKMRLAEIQAFIYYLKTESANLTVAKDAVIRSIDEAFCKYVQILEMRKADLKLSLMDQYNVQEGNILEKLDVLTNNLKDLKSTVEQAEKVSSKGPLAEVVCTKTMLLGCLEEADTLLSPVSQGNNYVQYDSDKGLEELQECVGRLGEVMAEHPLPSNITIASQCLKACLPSSITLRISSFPNIGATHCSKRVHEHKLPHYPLGVQVHDCANSTLPCSLEHGEGNDYQVTFTPQVYGKHRIVPTFLGQTMAGLEMDVTVPSNNPVQVIGGQGSGMGRFQCPRAIALDRDGYLYVADTGNKLIQKFDTSGVFVSQFRIDNGKEDCSTCDLALDQQRGLIVCTETAIGSGMNPTMGSTVATYNLHGVLQHSFVNKVMKCALCVAINSQGHILVSDYLVHTLFMYDNKGAFLRRIGNAGTFNHPAFIAVGRDDTVIVSDTNNDCVQVFDRSGHFKFQFGTSGSGKGQLKQPFGVETDGDDIIVVDSGNRRIQVFTNTGKFVSIIDSEDDPLDQPRGVAVTADGYLFVADRDNNCIKKYKYK